MRRFTRKLGCKILACGALALAIFSGGAPASADEYDPQRAGHPLRIVAYGLHPVGVVLDLLILRPAHWIGSYEPIALFFGHETYRR
ncbi:MAG TPA: hypothetical protein VIY27_09015 [Myxococcota bacterium]